MLAMNHNSLIIPKLFTSLASNRQRLHCCQGFETTMRGIYPPSTGVGDRWQGARANSQKLGKIFLCNYHIKFGHFVNFAYIYFQAKTSCPPKLTELLRLCTYAPFPFSPLLPLPSPPAFPLLSPVFLAFSPCPALPPSPSLRTLCLEVGPFKSSQGSEGAL